MKDINDKQRIGEKIVELRNEYNYSQDDLAKLSGFARTTVSKIENGKYNASIDLLSKLVKPLGVKVDLVKSDE